MQQMAGTPLAASGVFRSVATPSISPRWGTVAGGTALVVFGLSRRSWFGSLLAATGGGLAYYAYSSATPQERQSHASVLLNCSPEDAFRLWRNFEIFPRFMRHLESVTVSDAQHSRWTFRGPLGRAITLNSEIVDERENEFIAWRSLPNSDLIADGDVEFRRAPGNRGTVLEAKIHFRLPAGSLGRAVGKLIGKDANFMLRQDLRRLKALIETGEIPTTEGQPHGPRSLSTAAARLLNPDEPMRHGISPLQAVQEQRRVS